MKDLVFFIGEGEEDIVLGRHFFFRSVRQQARLAGWAADADADTEEVLGTEPVDDIGDAVVSGAGRGFRRPDGAFRDIEIIVHDCEIFFGDLIIVKECCGRFPRKIHVSLRFGEKNFVPTPLSPRKERLEAIGWFEYWESPFLSKEIKEEEPDIVPCVLIFFTGISETKYEEHMRKR